VDVNFIQALLKLSGYSQCYTRMQSTRWCSACSSAVRSANLAAESRIETGFREAVRVAIQDSLVSPLSSNANAFVKAAIFHPDVCRLLQHELLSEAVFQDCVKSIRRDIDALSGEGTVASEIANVVFMSEILFQLCFQLAPCFWRFLLARRTMSSSSRVAGAFSQETEIQ
jgi:hypothetical protein